MSSEISFDDISISFKRRQVLHELNWTVRTGITGLLGPNGAGKTTLLSIAVGLTRPSSGRVEMRHRGELTKRIGFVPQRFSLAGEMTVKDTLAYAAWVNGVPTAECGLAAERAINVVQLGEKRAARVRSLSGGQRQRVGVAAALVHDPGIVILDEPTVGLDPGQRLRLREVIAQIAVDRVVLISTHLVEDVMHLCQTVGVLAAGQIRFNGTTSELEARMGDMDHDTATHGSSFERAYNTLITELGAHGD